MSIFVKGTGGVVGYYYYYMGSGKGMNIMYHENSLKYNYVSQVKLLASIILLCLIGKKGKMVVGKDCYLGE